MNNLDDTIQHELLESLTLLEQAARQYISASGGGGHFDASEEFNALQEAQFECLITIKDIRKKYSSISNDDYKKTIVNIFNRSKLPADIIREFNAKINKEIFNKVTITASGKRKRIKRKTHKHRNSKRIKRKSHRRSYRIKKM
jgi:hypothetical protein